MVLAGSVQCVPQIIPPGPQKRRPQLPLTMRPVRRAACLRAEKKAGYYGLCKESLRLHAQWKGKIEVNATVPVATKDDLSLAYTPGVAQPCLEIQKDVNKSYELTRRWNLCAVITDGSAVLGLGDIGRRPECPLWRENAFCSNPSAAWTPSRSA